MIEARYLLGLNVRCHRDLQGVHWVDPLWRQDLVAHLRHIRHLTLASPCALTPESGMTSIEGTALRFCDLPDSRSLLSFLLLLPKTLPMLWEAAGDAEIVHTCVAGWPIPLGWLLVPIAKIRGRQVVIVVESAPWRVAPGVAAGWRQRLRAAFSELAARWCLRRADLCLFTHDGYRNLLAASRSTGHTIAASWIGEQDLLTPRQAQAEWEAKLSSPLQLVFAGRLEPSKGIRFLLEALRRLTPGSAPVSLTIVGDGPLFGECESAASSAPAHLRIQVLHSVPYGEAFFALLRRHHAVVVPSLSDEQPRIVYDAFSQALPVLASDTPGLSGIVLDGTFGFTAPAGRVEAWVELLQNLSPPHRQLRTMGLAAIQEAQTHTHEQMHVQRERLLRRYCIGNG